MKKTFRSILAEQDQEYTYVVKSIYNIHDSDMMDWVRLALLPYDLRELTKGTYTPPDKDQTTFPNVPNAPVYTLKAKLGLDPQWEDATEKVSVFTRIRDFEHLVVHPEGMDPKKDDNSDVEEEPKGEFKSNAKFAKTWDGTADKGTIDPDAQNYVGANRFAAFMKELDKDRKEREASIPTVEPNLKEAFYTSHLAIKEVIGVVPKGFYVIERAASNPNVLNISGPFSRQPDNYEFVAEMTHPAVTEYRKLDNSTIYAKSNGRDFTYIIEKASSLPIYETKYGVMVQDQDTGKTYDVVVEALDDAGARDAAVALVATENKLDSERLIATDPEVAGM